MSGLTGDNWLSPSKIKTKPLQSNDQTMVANQVMDPIQIFDRGRLVALGTPIKLLTPTDFGPWEAKLKELLNRCPYPGVDMLTTISKTDFLAKLDQNGKD